MTRERAYEIWDNRPQCWGDGFGDAITKDEVDEIARIEDAHGYTSWMSAFFAVMNGHLKQEGV
jgi:hypothetical protein